MSLEYRFLCHPRVERLISSAWFKAGYTTSHSGLFENLSEDIGPCTLWKSCRLHTKFLLWRALSVHALSAWVSLALNVHTYLPFGWKSVSIKQVQQSCSPQLTEKTEKNVRKRLKIAWRQDPSNPNRNAKASQQTITQLRRLNSNWLQAVLHQKEMGLVDSDAYSHALNRSLFNRASLSEQLDWVNQTRFTVALQTTKSAWDIPAL